MLRTILLLTALAGCADDNPHDVVTCEAAYPMQPTQCEIACAEMPTGGSGTCVVTFPGTNDPATGMPLRGECGPLFRTSYDGDDGCCFVPPSGPVRFLECE